MAKNRKYANNILIDIRYKWSMNKFEEVFGDSVSYASIEQESYIDLKQMVFEYINKDIKFRKFNRENNTLILKVDMLQDEYDRFLSIIENEVVSLESTKDSMDDEEYSKFLSLIKNEDYIDRKTLKESERGFKEKIKYKEFNFLHDFTISQSRVVTDEELKELEDLK